MNKKAVLIFLTMSIFSTIAYSQIFEENKESEIRDSSIILLNKYVKYADLTEDGNTFSEIYKTNFLQLFTENAVLANDIYGKKSFLTPRETVKFVEQKYDGGIEVRAEVDSAKFLNYKIVNGDIYSVQAKCKKYTIGLNKNNKIERKDILATFTIQYIFKNDSLSNFRISEIISEEIISKTDSDNKMKALYIGATGSILAGQVSMDNNIQYYSRNYQLSGATSIGICADYFFDSHYAVSLGANYQTLNSNFSTIYNNENDNNLSRTDIDSDNYFLYVNSDIEEKINLQYISIPISFKYRHKLYNEISFIGAVGFSTSYILSSTTFTTGSSTHTAWYDDYNLLVDDANLYNLGEQTYNESYDLLLTDLFFSGNIELGIF